MRFDIFCDSKFEFQIIKYIPSKPMILRSLENKPTELCLNILIINNVDEILNNIFLFQGL